MGASASRERFLAATGRLTGEEVTGEDVEFWDELWKLGSTSEEVFSVLSPSSIRLLRRSHFVNLSTLITQSTAQLCQLVETPYSIYFDQALNCVRVLTRLLPFVMEDIEEAERREEDGMEDTEGMKERVEELCWGEGEPDDEGDEYREPIGLLVVHAAMHMLFLPQFTCDYFEEPEEAVEGATTKDEQGDEGGKGEEEDAKKGEGKPLASAFSETDIPPPPPTPPGNEEEASQASSSNFLYNKSFILKPTTKTIVWAYGPGVHQEGKKPHHVIENPAYMRNRIEVLRLLLSCTSECLFVSPLPLSRWTGTACGLDAPKATELWYSLINVVLGENPNKGTIPYSGVFGGEGKRELIELCVQLLIVLLDFGSPGLKAEVGEGGEKQLEGGKGTEEGSNVFRTMLRNMDGEYELNFAFQGFSNILNSVHMAANTYLPGSMKGAKFYQETLVLLWQFLEENEEFERWCIEKEDVNELVVPICYLMYSSRSDPTSVGLMHMCAFILLKLSGSRSFCIALNRPFRQHLPIDLPLFTGTHADLLAITIHKLISDGTPQLDPLRGCMVTTICNISPYWRGLSLVASLKVVNLLEIFTSPRRLYGQNSEENIGYAALILEVFNNVVQYQFTGNEQLVYAMVRKKAAFLKLSQLKVDTAKTNWTKVNGGGKETEGAEGEIPQSDNAAPPPSIPAPSFAIPDQDWVSALKEKLPLETTDRLLKSILPLIDDMIKSRDGVVDEEDILELLRNTTVVGLLPVPHPIVIRQYQPNEWTDKWFTSYLWGVIFLRNQKLPIFDGDSIKLFQVTGGEMQ